jgi:hypothetical protein
MHHEAALAIVGLCALNAISIGPLLLQLKLLKEIGQWRVRSKPTTDARR